MKKKMLLVCLCLVALVLVGCNGSDSERRSFCEEQGFDGWKWENGNSLVSNVKDFDILCIAEETHVTNSPMTVNYTEQWFSDYEFQEWRMNKGD